MTALTEFLLARIAEDEAPVKGLWSGDGDPDFFWGPDRIRAECEAKRRIVEGEERTRTSLMRDCDAYSMTTRLLAAVYADHPDYRDEWRP